MMKVNVDAALSKNMNVAAMAVVARDEKGKFQGASLIVLDGVSSPETAEAMACREVVLLRVIWVSRRSGLLPTVQMW